MATNEIIGYIYEDNHIDEVRHLEPRLASR